MRAFIIVLVVATVVGGFVGGELMGTTFSLTGAVVGGVGVGAVLLGLGAFFHAQEEKKRKQSVPSDVRAVFDRMMAPGQSTPIKPLAGWKPRPFHKNESKEQTAEWFAHVEPWSRLDPRLMRVLTERLYGNPMFELFVHASQNCGVIPQYAPLRGLFDKGVGDVAACPNVAKILGAAGAKHAMIFAGLLQAGKRDKSVEEHYQNALDACEAAIHVEPGFLSGYVQLGRMRQLVGKTDDAIQVCMRGLVQVERMKKAPLPSRPDMNLAGAVGDAEAQLRSLLQTLRG